MTSTLLTWVQPTPLRRTTFVGSPADDSARRIYLAVTTAAALVSATAVGAVAPFVF